MQNKIKANTPQRKTEAKSDLKTDRTEKTTQTMMQQAILRICRAVLVVNGEHPVLMQAKILFA